MSHAYSPLARIVPKGATLPSNPTDGMLWLHNPTGREVLMVYANGAWNPLESFGSMTVYVDTASGTDNQNNGFATGANAYKTVQFAVNQIPGLVGGNVTINPTAAIYREEVIIQGKNFTGNYTITIQGTKGTDVVASTTATSGANGAGNGSAGYGTITKTGATYTVNAFVGKFIEITAGTGVGQIYVIHSNTATVITVTGQWGTIPDNTSVYHVFDAGTRITGSNAGADTTPVRSTCVTAENGQEGINLNMLLLNYAASFDVYALFFASVTITNCQLTNAGGFNLSAAGNCSVEMDYSYSAGAGAADVAVSDNSVGGFTFCRLNSGGTGTFNTYITGASECSHTGNSYLGKGLLATGPDKCIYVELCSLIYLEDYLECDGGAVQNIHVVSNSVVNATLRLSVPADCRSINSTGWGCLAETGGFGQGVHAITYSGNTSGTFSPVGTTAGGTN